MPEVLRAETPGEIHYQNEGGERAGDSPENFPKASSHIYLGDGVAQWVMAFFGFVATCVSVWAVILLKSTLKATRQTNEAATVAAEAALKQAELLVKVERPYLTLSNLKVETWFKIKDIFEGELPNSAGGMVHIYGEVHNQGSKAAFVREVVVEHTTDFLPESPPLIIKEVSEWLPLVKYVPGESKSDSVPVYSMRMRVPEMRQMCEGGERADHIYGYVRYSDVHGMMRRTGFAFAIQPGPIITERNCFDFIDETNIAYWYDIEEKPENGEAR